MVEVTAGNLEAFLARMAQREREFPRTRVTVVADRPLTGYEWVVREAGAVMFLTSPRRMALLGDLARRHLATLPKQPLEITERIRAHLPWRA